jgi:hypothetical protein
MVLRVALAGLPLAAVVVLVVLLNSLDASAGIAVAALGLVAVASGAALAISPTGCQSSRRPAAVPTALDA